jgi:SRSO17 transposase
MAGRYQQEAAVALCPCARARFADPGRCAEETLLIEWPKGEAKPAKYWLATVDPNMSLRRLVDLAKLRWRIEHDYRDLKQEIGIGHMLASSAVRVL